jgi:N-dimethylarginine dimethylaminohydrolase
LIDDRFYHLDTAFCPINDDLIAVYEPAFSKEALKKIHALDCEILLLN